MGAVVLLAESRLRTQKVHLSDRNTVPSLCISTFPKVGLGEGRIRLVLESDLLWPSLSDPTFAPRIRPPPLTPVVSSSIVLTNTRHKQSKLLAALPLDEIQLHK